MGFSQNANRAGSVVAHDIFYSLVANPLLLQSGHALTHNLGPKYHTDQYRVVIYHEEAKIEDSQLKLDRVKTLWPYLTDIERREYLKSGRLDIDVNEWTDEDSELASDLAGGQPVGRSRNEDRDRDSEAVGGNSNE